MSFKTELCKTAYALTGMSIMACSTPDMQDQAQVQDLLQNPEVKQQFIETPKGKLWVETANLDAKGQCEVYVHGNSAPSIWMDDLVQDRQEQGKCTVRFDLPGHGKSERADNYSINTMTDALHSVVIDDLHLDVRPDGYSVVGWSYGGDIGIQGMAQGKLDGMNNLVLLGTPPIDLSGRTLPPAFRSDTFAAKEVIPGGYNLKPNLDKGQLTAMSKSFFCHNDANPDSCVVPQNLVETVAQTDPKVRGDILPSIQKGEFKDEITALQNRGNVDLCVIYGGKDAFISGAFMDAVNNVVKPEYTAVMDTAHAIPLEDPKGLSKHLDACFSTGMKL